eukprot:COSAG04_NODE_7016_length_1209_cov_1.002703_1_plen_331_part_10
MDVAPFPGEKRICSCGGKGEVFIHGTVGGSWGELTEEWCYTGHAKTARGVQLTRDGGRVVSCSKDSTIHVLKLEKDSDGVVRNGECVQKLEGHRDLVDRCFLFDDDKLLLSASWDNDCRVWELETGKCLRTLEGDNAKMRGCAVYKEGKTLRAVGAGSGGYLCVWDLDFGEQKDVQRATHRIRTGHSGSIWGLTCLERPDKKGSAPIVVTVGDSTLRCFDLTHVRSPHSFPSPQSDPGSARVQGQERELVGGRRALAPSPMCVAALPATFKLGEFSLLVGAFQCITAVDVSNIESQPSAGAIWAGRQNLVIDEWIAWLEEAIDAFSAQFLY